jgi:hypothetical protein
MGLVVIIITEYNWMAGSESRWNEDETGGLVRIKLFVCTCLDLILNIPHHPII